MQPDNDIDQVLGSTKVPTPYIIGIGEDILHLSRFYIICESEILPYKIYNFKSAVVTLLSCHYVFNIEYPTQTHTLCKFLEKFCIGLNNLKKLSASSIGIISAIEHQ